MRTKKLMLFVSICFINLTFAQRPDKMNKMEFADSRSLELYNLGDWVALLQFGEETIKSGTDFPLLKMRTAYAAFILKKYSKSLKYYEAVYNSDTNNSAAAYYCYLNNLYLNNVAATRYYASKLDEETKKGAKLKPFKISELGLEYSYKRTSIQERGDGQYARFNLNTQLGYKLEAELGVASFSQIINEPQFLTVTQNNKIDISQKEYFAKLIYTPLANLSFIGGYYYTKTPFNNFSYNNTNAFGGIKYTSPYIHLQGLAHFATVTDNQLKQYDLSISTYPRGNADFYTISKATYSDRAIFTQVVGAKIIKNTWLEVNSTFGNYTNLIANDGLYLINDVDTKKLKIGSSIYALVANKFLLSLNYNWEQKQRYKTTTNFNQNSITINLKWKL